ncbi:unnamed protein product [Aureobasidium vineae]|uniref:Splicing factor YJU2 n=1 Tax=Aureobasidium vineae TaxID=2773715 RepID=A0A9N8JGV8_9PEZI|nr:unnamed protein product [Aureobasidium vineae]
MSERKVISKYYPPDFDPNKITRWRKTQVKLPTITLMSPFSMRCNSCGEFIYKGRKFNARKEPAVEQYLNIPIDRFYIRCTACSSEITFKTDPKNTDYKCENGATRNFEPWRATKLAEETEEEGSNRFERAHGEKDLMVSLETKTLDAKTEMAVADALDEIRMRNARREIKVRALENQPDLRHADAQLPPEDNQATKKALCNDAGERVRRVSDEEAGVEDVNSIPTFQSFKRQKKNHGAALGIKRK